MYQLDIYGDKNVKSFRRHFETFTDLSVWMDGRRNVKGFAVLYLDNQLVLSGTMVDVFQYCKRLWMKRANEVQPSPNK